MQVLKAGSSFSGLSPHDIVHSDLKEFQMGEYRVAIGQLSVMDPAEILAKREALQEQMEIMCQQEGFDLVALMVTDILQEATHLVYIGQAAGLVAEAFGRSGEAGVLYLPGVMSRKKQVVPPMVEASRT
jgi:manganese-dependent inorganic pyrophosphatase